MNPIDWLVWFNGKKSKIGAVLFVIATICGLIVGALPALQTSLVDLGLPLTQVELVYGYVMKFFLFVGGLHAIWKKFFNLPDEAPLNKQGGYSRPSVMGLLALITGAILAFGACNKVPPNLSPIGGTAFRVAQVVTALDTIGDVAVKAEKQGLIQHSETLLVADVIEKSARAAADLGRAFQAGEGQESAKMKAITIIRKALSELPDHLSQRGREIVQPYINVALAALALIG
jgi:hypothetical protein